MIKFITDQWPGEPDILTPVKDEALYIVDLDKKPLVKMPGFPASWTHEMLENIGEILSLFGITDGGADAYLGDQFVGSTEV